jgi:dipeptidyl aminopeptidase/acylaminoacyl peptidase
VYGQKAIARALNARGFPAKTWVMPKAGHWYSANIDEIMRDAMDWCIEQGEGGSDHAATHGVP